MAISIAGVSSASQTRQISSARNAVAKNLDRLGSGKRIRSASDNAAGLAIAKQLQASLGSTTQANRNIEYGVSQADIADGALSQQHGLVSRMRELAVQSGNGTLSKSDRAVIQSEMSALRNEVGRIAKSTEFNGNALLQGGSTDVQVGTGNGSADRISISTPDSGVSALGLDVVDLSTQGGAQGALDALDNATKSISTSRAEIGATRNRFVGAMKENTVTIENIASAASRIEDTNIAEESGKLSLNKTREAIAGRLSKFEQGISAGMLLDLIA